VDLKNYILPSHEKTFLSLRDQGLIDLDRPEASKILRLIDMRPEDRKGAALIQEQMRKAEYDAFAAWLKASCADPRLRSAPRLGDSDLARPKRPVEVIRHARKDRLLESFEQYIWALRFRCMGCHTEGTEQCEKNRREFGARVAWIKAAGPEATMNYLIKKKKLVDPEDPERSLLLLKPLGEVKHGGGKKFLPGDLGYKAFRAWIEDYARTINDDYASATDLPRSSSNLRQFGSDIWLKLADTPPAWGDRLLLVKLFAWNAASMAWEASPIATSDRGVWGQGKLWQHSLVLLAPRNSEQARQWQRGRPMLAAGRYLVKVYVDTRGRLEKDWTAEMSDDDCVGQVEINARWAHGAGQMTVVAAGQVRR
jgi:hypothetical protein